MSTKPDFGPPRNTTAIPYVAPGSTPSDYAAAIAAIKEHIDVRNGTIGDGMDRAVTVRDLLNASIAEPVHYEFLFPNGVLPGLPAPNYPQDSAIPPTPENLQAAGTSNNIILTWEFPREYGRLSYFEVWRSLDNVIGNAVLIGKVPATIFVDAVTTGSTHYYWVKAVSDAGSSPFSSLTGVQGDTGLDPGEILDSLIGQITEEHLFVDLGARIDLIDAPTTGLVTQVTNLNGQYSVKIDANGYVAGYGLSNTPVNGTPFSSFIVRADSFAIGSPSGPGVVTPAVPFIVRTTPTTIGGVTVPIGVYIGDAFIQNGTIGNAKIANAAIDDAKIVNLSAAKITAGFLDAARVQVGSLNGDRITARTITADRIVANAISATEIAANAVYAAAIQAGAVNATKINVSSLSSMTAVIGMLRTATSGARIELSDNLMEGFNGSNVRRFKLSA